MEEWQNCVNTRLTFPIKKYTKASFGTILLNCSSSVKASCRKENTNKKLKPLFHRQTEPFFLFGNECGMQAFLCVTQTYTGHTYFPCLQHFATKLILLTILLQTLRGSFSCDESLYQNLLYHGTVSTLLNSIQIMNVYECNGKNIFMR